MDTDMEQDQDPGQDQDHDQNQDVNFPTAGVNASKAPPPTDTPEVRGALPPDLYPHTDLHTVLHPDLHQVTQIYTK